MPYTLYLQSLARANARVRVILRMAGELGLRRGEIAEVSIDRDLYCDQQGWLLTVHGKGGRSRKVPVTAELAKEMRDRGEGYLLPGKIDGHLSPRRVSELANEALSGRWTIHKLRHMFASRTYAISGDLVSVQTLLGHSSPTTTKNYVAVEDSRLRAIVESVATKSFRAEVDERLRKADQSTVTIDFSTISEQETVDLILRLAERQRLFLKS